MRRILATMLFTCLIAGFMFALAPITKAGTWEYDFTNADNWKNDWEVITGEFGVVDGTLTQTFASADDNNVFRCLAVTGWEIEDGTIEARVMHHGAGLNDALVFYRMTDADNGYASRLQLDGYITIGRITAGKHAHIKYTPTPVVAEQLYTIKIELSGDTITVYVDDEEKVTVDDDISPKGRVGFGMSRCAGGASLQSISVTANNVTTTSVDINGKSATCWGDIKK